MDQAVLISIDVADGKGKKESFVKNKLERVDRTCTFETLFSNSMGSLGPISDDLKVYISPTLTRKDEVEVNKHESLSFVSQLFEAKSIYFLVTRGDEFEEEAVESTVERNAFQLMMAPPDRRLGDMAGDDMKVKLHNDILHDMQGDMALLSGRVGQNEGRHLFKKITDAVWYLDGRKETLNNTSRKRKGGEILATPQRFEKYSGYQDWVKWKKKPRLDEKDCDMHATSLISAVENDLIRWPDDWKEDIVRLSSSLSSYARSLRQANQAQQSRQSKLHPVRQLLENATGQYWPSIERGKVHTDLLILSDFMENSDDFEPVLVEDEHFPNNITPAHKMYLLGNIALTVPVQAIR